MPETPPRAPGSRDRTPWLAPALLVILGGCGAGEPAGAPSPGGRAAPAAPRPPRGPAAAAAAVAPAAPAAVAPAAPAAPPEPSLGVADRGIWSDLDDRIQLALPAGVTPDRVALAIAGDLLLLYVDGWPAKPYPLGGEATLAAGDRALALRPGDAAELAPLVTAGALAAVPPALGDRDGDGLPDPLDVLIGAKKTVAQASAYGGDYIRIGFPMGDVPRDTGKCADVVVRALRNAGLDLQAELQADLRRAPRSYPMVKKGDPHIDHRRVRTILPWFRRHTTELGIALDDPADPLRPGDIVFMDTFPRRSGPDHVGIVSDTIGPSGWPLVINAWTDGYVTEEMDLLGWVPLTHRFRL